MSQVVIKYTLDKVGLNEVRMPAEAKILSVHAQGRSPQLWALFDTEEEYEDTHIILVQPTGAPIKGDSGEFIGTVLLMGGDLEFHIFDLGLK